MSEIIQIKQLPIIEERLIDLSEDINTQVLQAKSVIDSAIGKLENTSDLGEKEYNELVKSVSSTIKKTRAELKKSSNDIEEQRKVVKKQILEPYNKFETLYKKYAYNPYKKADSEIKEIVQKFDNVRKQKKVAEIKSYFNEYCLQNKIDFITFEQTNINITLSASIKSLKTKVKDLIDNIVKELALIQTQEHKTEILVEYKQSLDVAQAITVVNDRYDAIRLEQEKEQDVQAVEEKTEERVQQVEVAQTIGAPKVVEENESEQNVTDSSQVKTVKFAVSGTLPQLIDLKKFLNDGGYTYESITS